MNTSAAVELRKTALNSVHRRLGAFHHRFERLARAQRADAETAGDICLDVTDADGGQLTAQAP